MVTIDINDIVIDDIHRKIYGMPDQKEMDILVEDIRQNGLLNPIILDEENHVISGTRRLEALRRLGWTEIPAEKYAFKDSEHRVRWIISNNRYRTKTKLSAIREGAILERLLDKPMGIGKEERDLHVEETLMKVLDKDFKTDLIADMVGLDPIKYYRGREVIATIRQLKRLKRHKEVQMLETLLEDSVDKALKAARRLTGMKVSVFELALTTSITRMRSNARRLLEEMEDIELPDAFEGFKSDMQDVLIWLDTWRRKGREGKTYENIIGERLQLNEGIKKVPERSYRKKQGVDFARIKPIDNYGNRHGKNRRDGSSDKVDDVHRGENPGHGTPGDPSQSDRRGNDRVGRRPGVKRAKK
jgi:ParB family chromosome partitioning protein